jgi:hypothetical protein
MGVLYPTTELKLKMKLKLKLYWDRLSVVQFVLVSCPFLSGWPDVTFLSETITFLFFHVENCHWKKCNIWSPAQKRANFNFNFNWVEMSWDELSWVYLTADGQSTSSSWYRAPLWGPWPYFILILSFVTIACFFFLQGALFDERTGL